MPQRCVVGGCDNTSEDGVSFHGWPSSKHFAQKWTNAVRNTREFDPTPWSKICSDHFEENTYESQSVIGQSIGVKIKKMLRKDAIPTVFSKTYSVPSRRKKKCIAAAESVSTVATSSTPSLEPVSKPQSRNAFRKREAGRIIAEYEQSTKIMKDSPDPDKIMAEEVSPSVSTQTICKPPVTKNSKTQTRFNNSSKAVQCKTQTKDQGVQCSLLQEFATSTPCQSEDDEDTSDEEEEDDDSTFGLDSDDDDQEDECTYEETPPHSPKHKQKLFLVAESHLLELFKFCPECHSECDRVVQSKLGTQVTISQTCLSCSFTRRWASQPNITDIPVGNLLMSSAILFGGGSPSKFLRILRHMNVPTIAYSTFMAHQKKYLHPAVETTYRSHQSTLLDEIVADGKDLILAGDGRCDSPGHSAKYSSYTMFDVERNKILDSQLVQSNEVKNSNAMEKEGLIRSLKFIKDRNLSIDTLITDRHTQIRKYMREECPSVKHRMDGWHVGKGTGKSIDTLSKQKDCADVLKWKKSLINHMFWCASSTDDDDGDTKVAKWLSLTNHIINKHTGHEDPLFPKCTHGRLRGRERKKKWLKAGTSAYEKLVTLLTKESRLKDIRQMSSTHNTSSLESFHAVLNHFAPKQLAFSYYGMMSRLQIAILHFNENSGRPQAKTEDGNERFNISFPKFKKGDYTVKKVLAKPSFKYVDELMDRVFSVVVKSTTPALRVAAPKPMSSAFARPDKETAVNERISRYKKYSL